MGELASHLAGRAAAAVGVVMLNSKGCGGSGGGRWQGRRCQRQCGRRSAIPALFTITEEEEGQRRRDGGKRKKKGTGLGVGLKEKGRKCD